MSVDEFMINYRFATKRDKSRLSRQIPQGANARIPLHTTKASLLHHENNNACVTKVEEAPIVEHREEEEGNNKAVISYIYHTLHFNEVL
jgi:hypothetical protein